MDTKRFAMLMGIVFIAIGILGFVPGITRMNEGDDPNLTIESFDGHLLGLFHVNLLHNLVHLLFGVMGVVMARTVDGAVTYARIVAVAYALLAVMGLISAANMNHTFGLVPIEGHDVWLHALIAAAAAYFGFVHHRAGTTTGTAATGTTGTV